MTATSAAEPAVLISRDGPIATLTMNRPTHFNALNTALLVGLNDALNQLATEPEIRVVVLTGAGRAFCSGADLSGGGELERHDGAGSGSGKPAGALQGITPAILDLPAEQRDAVLAAMGERTYRSMIERFNPLMLNLQTYCKPTIAAVNGVAAGAGVGLAIACDITVAADSAQFIQVFAPKLGLVTDCGVSYNLPRKIGSARAMALALLGEPLSAAKALEFGLIWQAVADADLLPAANKLAQRLASNPSHVNQAVRQQMDAAFGNDLAAHLQLEAELQRHCASQATLIEGVTAFREKRAPVFHKG